MNDKIETIRQACINANSQREWEEYVDDVGDHRGVAVDFPCRLADVLLALTLNHQWAFDSVQGGKLVKYESDGTTKMFWNLRADDLTQQSEETINFLADLLQ